MAKRKKSLEEEEEEESQSDQAEEQRPKKTRSGGKLEATATQNGKHRIPTKSWSSRQRDAEGDTPASEAEVELSAEANVSDDEVTPMRVNGTPKRTNSIRDEQNEGTPTKRTASKGLLNKKLFATPTKSKDTIELNETPRIQRNADRSARRKSTRNLIEKTILGNISDNEEENAELAGHIYASDREDDQGEEGGLPEESSAPATPSRRGRPKGTKNRQRSPTPPEDLAPHEMYFFHNRGSRTKTSNNNLSSLALLDHEEYFSRSRNMKDPHADAIKYLEDLHANTEDFRQWQFELSQQFNICIYGWGSKKSLLMKFADHIYKSNADPTKSKIVVVNGYVPNLTVKDVLNTIASAITERGHKLGAQPVEMLETLITILEGDKTQDITLIIHSIDRPPLRKPATQTILSRLAAHPQIHLVASADHPSFPLLWDSSLRSAYNFLFHDCTTFQPYTAEIDVVDEVHELLGRSGRRVGGKEGVSFVLKSLPENAKNLFRVLITEQLASMDDGTGQAVNEEDDEDGYDGPLEKQGTDHSTRNMEFGVEYRLLYNKAVEEFICTSEMAFRSLLKEFHDHQMIQSKKDALGTEMLSVPFRKEELETILEDIMG